MTMDRRWVWGLLALGVVAIGGWFALREPVVSPAAPVTAVGPAAPAAGPTGVPAEVLAAATAPPAPLATFTVPLAVSVPPGDPDAAWACVNALGVWSVAHYREAPAATAPASEATPAPDAASAPSAGPAAEPPMADPSGDPTVASACRVDRGVPLRGALRLAFGPGAAASTPKFRCEAHLAFAFTGLDGRPHRPQVRSAREGDAPEQCASAVAGLELAFRERIVTAAAAPK